MTAALLLHHLGPLHRDEQVLVYALAFGPFVLLGLVVWVSRRRDSVIRAAEQSAPLDEPSDERPQDGDGD